MSETVAVFILRDEERQCGAGYYYIEHYTCVGEYDTLIKLIIDIIIDKFIKRDIDNIGNCFGEKDEIKIFRGVSIITFSPEDYVEIIKERYVKYVENNYEYVREFSNLIREYATN